MNQPSSSPGRPAPRPSLQLELGETEGQGIYANLALISHSQSEFILDFARALPGLPKAKVYARILLTPFHAKALQRALAENITRFEEQHGPIPIGGDDPSSRSIGF